VCFANFDGRWAKGFSLFNFAVPDTYTDANQRKSGLAHSHAVAVSFDTDGRCGQFALILGWTELSDSIQNCTIFRERDSSFCRGSLTRLCILGTPGEYIIRVFTCMYSVSDCDPTDNVGPDV
jgi:hypothetical protein